MKKESNIEAVRENNRREELEQAYGMRLLMLSRDAVNRLGMRHKQDESTMNDLMLIRTFLMDLIIDVQMHSRDPSQLDLLKINGVPMHSASETNQVLKAIGKAARD